MKHVINKINKAMMLMKSSEKLNDRADKLEDKMAAIEKQIEKYKDKFRTVAVTRDKLMDKSCRIENDMLDLFNEARLEYTKGMDGPSEEKQAAWDKFLESLEKPTEG